YTPRCFTYPKNPTVIESYGPHLQSAKLELWAGVEKFEFDLDTLKSEAELEWLARELSDWLGIEISS
ncbi:MAG: serine/threonine protein kinase, partial [Dolichospermum sp.]